MIILLGGGGHASVLLEILEHYQHKIIGFTAPEFCEIKNRSDILYLGPDAIIEQYSPKEILLINAMGSTTLASNQKRADNFLKFKQRGYYFKKLIHPSAIIAKNAVIQEGAQIMAAAVIQPNVVIGQNVIINTRSSIDHDCHIGDHVHVAPGVVMSGNVEISQGSFIGVGSVLIQGVQVSENSFIRAGSRVLKDVVISKVECI